MNTINDTLSKQNHYTDKLQQQEFDFGIVVGAAFVRGMRDLGYKHVGTALAEHIDNSIEAGAQNVLVALGFNKGSDKKHTQVAIVDDGHGMEPTMIRAAALWGGTHREGSRELFGRYGFGLPSAAVYVGKRFEIYSRTEGGEWHMVPMDLEDMTTDPEYRGPKGIPVVPPTRRADPPAWLQNAIKEDGRFGDLRHGTVVLIDKIDKNPKTSRQLTDLLLTHFGVTYRNFLGRLNIYVHHTKVEKIDPLFTTDEARHYDENPLRAVSLPGATIPVRDKDEDGNRRDVLGMVRVRYSYLPPGFLSKDGRMHRGTDTNNERFAIAREHNGIIVLRAGRQIDVVPSCPWTKFVNYDRYINVEIDFDPALDDLFSVTTSKQQIVPTERMWEILKQAGVATAIKNLREQFWKDKAIHDQEQDKEPKLGGDEDENDKPQSIAESIMGEANALLRQPPLTPEGVKERKRELQKEVEERATKENTTPEEAEKKIVAESRERPFDVSFEDRPEGDFYRVEGVTQVRLVINRSHQFFRQLYRAPGVTPRQRTALQIMLFCLADGEHRATPAGRQFYREERKHWSRVMEYAFDRLEDIYPLADSTELEAGPIDVDLAGVA